MKTIRRSPRLNHRKTMTKKKAEYRDSAPSSNDSLVADTLRDLVHESVRVFIEQEFSPAKLSSQVERCVSRLQAEGVIRFPNNAENSVKTASTKERATK